MINKMDIGQTLVCIFVSLFQMYICKERTITLGASSSVNKKVPVPGAFDGHLYASVAHMEPLVDLETRLLTAAKDYLKQEREKLDGMKSFADAVKKSVEVSKKDATRYLGNPVNSYLIIKRFTSGWKQLAERLTVDDSKLEEVQHILEQNKYLLPTQEDDMIGATAAIFRLQDTYGVSAREISDGNIKGTIQASHQLTASDCMEISQLAHDSRRYMRMYEWVKEAGRLYDDPNMKHRWGKTPRVVYAEMASWAEYLNGNMSGALHYTREALKYKPDDSVYKHNEQYYGWSVQEGLPCDTDQCTWIQKAKDVLSSNEIYNRYNDACRGGMVKKGIKNHANLVCFYKQDTPRLVLKPVKVTRVHDNPEVLTFHEVMPVHVMEKLKEIATPHLRQAEVVDEETQEITHADYRVAKSMWMFYQYGEAYGEMNEILDRVTEDLTGLKARYSEDYQVQNYGLGGQYEFHHDYGEEGSILEQHKDGNRLATLLYYLSDVERGGNTVFTKIGVSSAPKRGDATFWYNLHRNGTGNELTEHAGCPVIAGSKWVMNKWFKLAGNEFIRPCLLDRNA